MAPWDLEERCVEWRNWALVCQAAESDARYERQRMKWDDGDIPAP